MASLLPSRELATKIASFVVASLLPKSRVRAAGRNVSGVRACRRRHGALGVSTPWRVSDARSHETSIRASPRRHASARTFFVSRPTDRGEALVQRRRRGPAPPRNMNAKPPWSWTSSRPLNLTKVQRPRSLDTKPSSCTIPRRRRPGAPSPTACRARGSSRCPGSPEATRSRCSRRSSPSSAAGPCPQRRAVRPRGRQRWMLPCTVPLCPKIWAPRVGKGGW